MEEDVRRRLEGFDPEQVFNNLKKYLTGNWTNASFSDFKFKVLT